MNHLLKTNLYHFHYSQLASSQQISSSSRKLYSFPFPLNSPNPTFASSPISCSKHEFRNPRTRTWVFYGKEDPFCGGEVVETKRGDEEVDLATDGAVYNKTLRLVECSMFAAVAGLAYFLSNSLSIENYFGCFFSFPIVISSMRWDLEAGRKTMVATAMLLLTLSGPVKASTYLARSKLGRLDSPLHNCIACSLSSGSSYGCSGVRSDIFILNKRKYTCSDNHKRPCFSHLLAHCNWCKYNPINELDICYIRDFGFVQLCIFCMLAAHSVCLILYQAWHEGFFDVAKLA